jgi:hypothetical protein
MSEYEKRATPRVSFESAYCARIMGIDGTWQRACKIHDVSDGGAKLVIEGSIEGLGLKEFFLVLSSTGLAYRRCELTWVNGDFVGVTFLNRANAKAKSKRDEILVT